MMAHETDLQVDRSVEGGKLFQSARGAMEQAFGLPIGDIRQANGRKYASSSKDVWKDLWAGWEGTQEAQERIMINNITEKGAELLNLFPIMTFEAASKKYDWETRGNAVIISDWNFDTGSIESMGARSAGSINRTSVDQRTQGMSIHGNGFRLPMDFITRDDKKREYAAFIHAVERNVRDTWSRQVLDGLMRESTIALDKNQARAVSTSHLTQRFLYNWGIIGAMQKNGEGMDGMVNEVVQRFKERGVDDPTTVVVAAGCSHYLHAIRHHSFNEDGEMVHPAKRAKSMDTEGGARTAVHNLQVLESRRFAGVNQSESLALDPLSTKTVVSQRFEMLPGRVGNEFDKDYLSDSRSIGVVNAKVFSLETIALQEAFNHCGLFRRQGVTTSSRTRMSSFRQHLGGGRGGGHGGPSAGVPGALSTNDYEINPKLFHHLLHKLGLPEGAYTAHAMFKAAGILPSLVAMLQEPMGGTNQRRMVLLDLHAKHRAGAVVPGGADAITTINRQRDFTAADTFFTAALGAASPAVKELLNKMSATAAISPFKTAIGVLRDQTGGLFRMQYHPVAEWKNPVVQDGYTYLPHGNADAIVHMFEGERALQFFLLGPMGIRWALNAMLPPGQGQNIVAQGLALGLAEADVGAAEILGNPAAEALPTSPVPLRAPEALCAALGISPSTTAGPTGSRWYQWVRAYRLLGNATQQATLRDALLVIVNAASARAGGGGAIPAAGTYDPCDWLAQIPLTDYDFWMKLINYNIPFPVGFLLFRMHLCLQVGSAVFFKRGESTGVLAIKDANVSFTRDNNSFSLTVAVRMTSGTFIDKPQNLELMPGVFIQNYEGGGGVSFYDPANDGHVQSVRDGQATRDLFCVVVPYQHNCDMVYTDITGHLHSDIGDPDVAHYATSDVYRQLYGWQANKYALFHNRLQQQHIGRVSVCAKSSQMLYNYQSKRCAIESPGLCAMGPRADPSEWRKVLGGSLQGYSGSGFRGSYANATEVRMR